MALNSTIFLAETELRAGEGSGFVTARIIRTGSLDGEVKITYGVSSNTAVEGQDFVGGFGTVKMPDGAAEVSVQVRLLDDAVAEDTESLTFSLVNVEGATPWAPRTSRISILDDERPAPPPPSEPPLVSDYEVSEMPFVSGLNMPLKVEFSPVNPSRVYIAEKAGVIKTADLATGATSTVIDLSSRVNDYHDRGMVDVALHPDFANNPYLYTFAAIDPSGTAGLTGNAGPDGAGNRYAQVLRYTLDAATGYTTVVPGSEVVLLGKAGRSLDDVSGRGRDDFTNPAFAHAVASDRYVNTGAPAQTIINCFKQDYLKADSMTHIGGSMAFGPDGALYVSTGDGMSPNYADPHSADVLSLDSLSGKVLRIDPLTGQGLADNPFADEGVPLDSNRAKVWQLGLRNPFSIGFDGEGRLFIANVGWFSWEMIHSGGPGANFGWPFYEGGDGGVLEKAPEYRDLPAAQTFYDAVERGDITITAPFRAFSHDGHAPGFQVQGITGGSVIYTGDAYPSEFKNDYFFTDFSGCEVYTVDANDRTELKFLYQGGEMMAPLDFAQGPDGYVYYANLVKGEVGRLEIAPLAPPPPGGGSATTTVGTGPDALVLRITQDAYRGSAQYTVSVDGIQVGGVLTASALRGSGQTDAVTVRGDWGAGNHTVSVNSQNDAWDGTPATDRNLYIESGTYNGVAVGGAAKSLMSDGPATFGFTEAGAPPPPPPSGGGSATTTIGTGPDTLVLRVSQDAYRGNAEYTVSVDGVRTGGILTATALHRGGQSHTVTVHGDWGPGAHTVSVNFLNDAWDGTPATDRNLYVDGATYNGATVAGAAKSLMSDGPATFGFTEAGAPPPPAPDGGSGTAAVGTGPDALVLRITQDAYQGPARYTVSVDGVQVGGVLTAQALRRSGQADAVTVRGNWAPGSHTVSVDFLNDAWDGTPATDRNLYLEGATYNGAAVAGATAAMEVEGPRSFGIADSSPIA